MRICARSLPAFSYGDRRTWIRQDQRNGTGGRIDAIAAKDGKRFGKLFDELTLNCNGCHQSMERGYIAIRVPTEQPFSNQVFAPRVKP